MVDSMYSRYNPTTRYEEIRLDFEKRQGDIAEVLGVKRNTYSKWENCINDMPLEKCNELANYYHTSMDYLLGLSNIQVNIEEILEINWDILSKRIYELRINNGFTQQEISTKLGFPQTTYSGYETGNRKPTTLKLLVIAQFYNISSDYILGRTNNKEIK